VTGLRLAGMFLVLAAPLIIATVAALRGSP
jgi:hypothetical protein